MQKIFNKEGIKKVFDLQHSRYISLFVVKALTSNLFGRNFSNATLSSKINLRTILNSSSVSDLGLMRKITGGHKFTVLPFTWD